MRRGGQERQREERKMVYVDLKRCFLDLSLVYTTVLLLIKVNQPGELFLWSDDD